MSGRVKEVRIMSAHGNETRVRWTPDGLLVNYGAGWLIPSPSGISDGNGIHRHNMREFCSTADGDGCACPQARMLKPPIDWDAHELEATP